MRIAIAAGATRVLVSLPPGNQAQSFWQAAQTRLETVVCYCSIYDECWQADTRAKESAPVGACADDPAAEFGS